MDACWLSNTRSIPTNASRGNDIEDNALLLLLLRLEMLDRRLAGDVRTSQIDLDELVPRLLWHVAGRLVDVRHSSIVDQHVHLAKLLDCLVHELFDVLLFRAVALDSEDTLLAICCIKTLRRGGETAIVNVGDDYVAAIVVESLSNGQPETASSACHDDRFAGVVQVHGHDGTSHMRSGLRRSPRMQSSPI